MARWDSTHTRRMINRAIVLGLEDGSEEMRKLRLVYEHSEEMAAIWKAAVDELRWQELKQAKAKV